jgi:hypothetical protein
MPVRRSALGKGGLRRRAVEISCLVEAIDNDKNGSGLVGAMTDDRRHRPLRETPPNVGADP